MTTLAVVALFGLLRLSMWGLPQGGVEDPAGSEGPAIGDALVIEDDTERGENRASGQTAVAEPAEPASSEAFGDREPGELFVEANRWYEDGEYARAAAAYRALVDRGLGSSAVHYNLGNALLRGGRLGAAIASYRRARLLAPRDQDLDANLRFARASARDALEPPAPGAVRRTLFFWHYGLSLSETIRLAILCSAVLFGALALMLRRRGSEPLRWVVVVAGVVLVAACASLVCRWALPLRVAVVLPQEVEAYSGTDADTVVRFRLHAGTEVLAAETSDGWVRIVLPGGEQGWVEREQVELVRDLR